MTDFSCFSFFNLKESMESCTSCSEVRALQCWHSISEACRIYSRWADLHMTYGPRTLNVKNIYHNTIKPVALLKPKTRVLKELIPTPRQIIRSRWENPYYVWYSDYDPDHSQTLCGCSTGTDPVTDTTTLGLVVKVVRS